MQASDPLDPRAVLGAVKAQPGNAAASRKPSATAGLDRRNLMSRCGSDNALRWRAICAYSLVEV
jgi:hypothetical protein